MDKDLERAVARIEGDLDGAVLTEQQVKRLRAKLGGTVPQWLVDLLSRFPLADVDLELDEANDESGLGCSMRWMDGDQIIDEATEAYPGIAALEKGYVPVAADATGGGDPYFVRGEHVKTAVLVRIPHGCLDENGELDEADIEIVCSHLVDFFAAVTVD